VHAPGCPFFGHPSPPASCPCPLKQAWCSLDVLVGHLRAAFEEHSGWPQICSSPSRLRDLLRRRARGAPAVAGPPAMAAAVLDLALVVNREGEVSSE